ncbi:MAG: EFR1 family ferrodoxin [Thermoplasmata archaeon]|nr:EFR1 family ferrodoxin [Thermoplasmata archaeon]
MESIDLYFFSGTGNTLLVVERMAEVFEVNGVPTRLHRMEDTDEVRLEPGAALGLGFPVAEQGTFPFVWDLVNRLPMGKGTPIFMVDTMLAYSGGVVGPMKAIVKKKGYIPIGAREITMPNNLFPRNVDPEKNGRKMERGRAKAEEYAKRLLEGKAKWGRVPGGSDIMASFSRSDRTWTFLRRLYDVHIDHELCVNCGLCVRLCPIDNIKMDDRVEMGDKCVFCMRCLAYCPKGAIYSGKGKKARYHAVEESRLLGKRE